MGINYIISAAELRNLYGKKLIGRMLFTSSIGDYPGGIAFVVELDPDPAAPEIPIQVNNPAYGEIGIFEWEDVILVSEEMQNQYMDIILKNTETITAITKKEE